MRFILRMLTWYHGQTLGTQIFTWRKGVKVGEDEFGNIYYQTRDGKKRWVWYKDAPEASEIPPDWHGWLHFTWDEPPTKAPLQHKPWEKPHHENLTGTPMAYVPAGSLRRPDPVERRDYEAWQPE
ncbi:MAG TPA: NADH:ubiquinone oxidoreductase subunit NDUFA12 [Rhodobacteraceae bacterium]|nr:NADH:ubiquinone oxidoreductase subunit NDUFA12 [Paracoccaceae bacterium]